MSTEKEISELQKFQKSFSLFSKKTESLSRLKLSFFDRMKKYEEEENLEKAYSYFGYLIRATNLSENIYFRISNEINEMKEKISFENVNSNTGDQLLDRDLNLLYLELGNYLGRIQKFLNNVTTQNNVLSLISDIVAKEKNLLEMIDHKAETFFNELIHQKNLHELIIQERELTNAFEISIKELIRDTLTFSQKIKNQINVVNSTAKQIAIKLKNRPLGTIYDPIKSAGKSLESHASIFAATIFGFSIVANIANIAGIVGMTIACKEIILLMAEVGEPLQAIPALENGLHNLNSKIKNTINVVFHRMEASSV